MIWPFSKFPEPPRRQSGNKTWRDFEALRQALSDLCDKRYGSSNHGDVSFYIGGNGKTNLTMKIAGCEYRADGDDPWEALEKLAVNTGGLSGKIASILVVP